MLNKTELLEAVKGLNMFNFDRFNKSYSILINPRVLEKGKNGGWQAKLKYICFHFWVHQHLTHLPRAPRKPVAWHSSINTMAPYCSARSQIPFKGATSPSMEKTPSVTTRRIRDDWGGQKQSPADQWSAHQSCQSNQYCNPYLTPTHRIMGLMYHETQMDTLLRSTSVNSESKKSVSDEEYCGERLSLLLTCFISIRFLVASLDTGKRNFKKSIHPKLRKKIFFLMT